MATEKGSEMFSSFILFGISRVINNYDHPHTKLWFTAANGTKFLFKIRTLHFTAYFDADKGCR